MKTALTIAGSDSCGGAGIQADIKTMTANGVYAMSAVTALTAQNTLGVTDIMEVSSDFLSKQLDCVFEDIRPDAVKIGMLPTEELISVVAAKLIEYKAVNVVVDPVMVATSGARLQNEGCIGALRNNLTPNAALLTPNIPEAEELAEVEISTVEDMELAAKRICEYCQCPVLIKGGHRVYDAKDVLYDGKDFTWFEGERIDNPNTHGTGCTLSSAIAANLAKGYELSESIRRAKEYISGALSAMLDLGKGSGPMNHAFDIHSKFAE